VPEQRPAPDGSVGHAIDLVKRYAKQETLDPLRGVGRWLAFGAAGSLLLGIGLLLLLLSLLRALQFETDVFGGSWNWVPYLITLVVTVGITVLALSRVRKTTLARPIPGTEQDRT
jgi:hypothetical protein